MDLKSIQANMTKVVLPGGDPDGVYVYNSPSNRHSTILYADAPDMTFFTTQKQYLNSLSEEQKNILASYSFVGDEVINQIMRGTATPETLMALVEKFKRDPTDYNFFKVELDQITLGNVVAICSAYVTYFRKLFSTVPVVQTPFRVYRGTKMFLQSFGGFVSTTYYPFFTVAMKDLFTGTDCCIYELTIQKGVRALWLEPISHVQNEREILVEPSVLHTSSPVLKSVLFIPGPSSKIQSTRQVQVYESTLSPSVGGKRRRRQTKRSKRKTRKSSKQ